MTSMEEQDAMSQVIFNNEDEAVLEALAKELKSDEAQKTNDSEEQTLVLGAIRNAARRTLVLKDTKIYSGDFGSSVPDPIIEEGQTSNTFSHYSTSPEGSKVGLAYTGGGAQWILAWRAPHPDKRLDIEAKMLLRRGSEGPIDWDEIERSLDAISTSQPAPSTPSALAQMIEGSNFGPIYRFVVPFF